MRSRAYARARARFIAILSKDIDKVAHGKRGRYNLFFIACSSDATVPGSFITTGLYNKAFSHPTISALFRYTLFLLSPVVFRVDLPYFHHDVN